MREKCSPLLAVALLVLLPGAAFAAPKKLPIPAPSAPLISIGNSAVPLTGPWKFAPGDSPWSMNPSVDSSDLLVKSPDWAQPAFDDSRWRPLDLTTQGDPFNLAIADNGTVPGWTGAGFPNLTGYAWYRLRIRVADPAQTLALKMPAAFDDAYQIYVNGKFAGQFGDFDASPPTLFYAKPATFPLPVASGGDIVLAIRFYMSPSVPGSAPAAGGMRDAPVLGQPLTLHLIESAQFTAIAYGRFGALVATLLFLLMAPAAIWLWFENRKELTFLWLFFNLAGTAVFKIVTALSVATSWIPEDTAVFWLYVILNPAWLAGWIIVWWYWFGLRGKRWIPIAAWAMAAANMFFEYCALSPARSDDFLPFLSRDFSSDASLALVCATCLLLLVVLYEGFRRDQAEALLAVIPIFLLELASVFYYIAPLANIPSPTLHIFSLGIDFASLASIVMALVIGALVLRRFLHNRVTHELARLSLQQELAQAHELQQRVLVPEDLHSPIFSVESEYLPAQVVSGDFYQTILGLDGSLLVIIGDVSGKGITAAMLVAVLIGAARTRASDNFDPASMLDTLNKRLGGRSGGHLATCLVAQFRPNGQLRIANSGHIPPYVNGCEIDLEGSLPLGIVGTLDPATKAFQLRPGDLLTFISDGVLEATNKSGELFGFERAREISAQSAAAIAQEARAFGQVDDITVLRITFAGDRHDLPTSNPAQSTRA